jgi:hypothetical protein
MASGFVATKRFFWVLFLFLSVAGLNAGIIRGRWEKVDTLSSGTLVIVETKSAGRFSTAFRISDDSSITFSADGQEQKFPKTEIQKISLQARKPDSSWDGVLYGAVIGGASGAAFGAIAAGGPSKGPWQIDILSRGDVAAICAVLGAGIGGLTGFIVDKTHDANEVLYEAP